jgi:hypothetical protein
VGTVTFYIGGLNGLPVGTAPLLQACSGAPTNEFCQPASATLNVTAAQLNPGANVLVAEFTGDAANDAPSRSARVTGYCAN